MANYSPGRASFAGPRHLAVCGKHGVFFAEDRALPVAKGHYTKLFGEPPNTVYEIQGENFVLTEGLVVIDRPKPKLPVLTLYDGTAGGWQLIDGEGETLLTAWVPTEAIALAIAKGDSAYKDEEPGF